MEQLLPSCVNSLLFFDREPILNGGGGGGGGSGRHVCACNLSHCSQALVNHYKGALIS